MTWEELQQWAKENGLDAEENWIVLHNKEKSFYFYADGEIAGQFSDKNLNVRVVLGENKTAEQMKHFILALIEEK